MLDDRELLGCEGLSAVHGSEAVVGNLEIRREPPGIQPLHRFRHGRVRNGARRSEEHTSELQSLAYLVCRLLLEKKKKKIKKKTRMRSSPKQVKCRRPSIERVHYFI